DSTAGVTRKSRESGRSCSMRTKGREQPAVLAAAASECKPSDFFQRSFRHYPRAFAHSLQSGVMRRRSALRNWLEYVPALAALKALELAPLPVAHFLARGYTRLLDLAIP